MSDEYPKIPLPKGVFRIPNKEEAFKTYFKTTGAFPFVDKIKNQTKGVPLDDVSKFVERRVTLGNINSDKVKKLPGTVGKAVAAGALAGVALEKGINKIKSMEGKEAEPEIPSEVEGKAKGGQAKVGKVMREFKKGELHSGKKGPVVKNPKQAIAIALSEAGMSKPQKKQDGGMVRFKKQYQMHNGKF